MRFNRKGRVLAVCALLASVVVAGSRTYEPGRANLVFPPELMRQVKGLVGFEGRPLGYTYEQMAMYPPDRYRLRVVENMFRDVEKITRSSGLLTDVLLAKKDTVEDIVTQGFGLLDARASREFEPMKDTTWGVSWISDSLDADGALQAVADSSRRAGVRTPMSAAAREGWAGLAPATKRLLVRLVLAATETRPLLR